MAKKSTAAATVTETPDTEVVETSLETTGDTSLAESDYGDDAVDVGMTAPGYEDQNASDVSLPFIKLVQPMTPELVEGKVQGIAAGMWMDGVSQRLWANPKGLLCVIATTRHEILEYIPREHGGGFVGRHTMDSEAWKKAQEDAKKANLKFGTYYRDADTRKGEDGNEMTETFSVFAILCDEDGSQIGAGIIPFKSSMIKCYKRWMTMIRSVQIVENGKKKIPPIYVHLSRLTTEGKKFGEGFAHIPVYTPANGTTTNSVLLKTDDRYIAAKQLHAMVLSGSAKVDYSKQNNDGEVGQKEVPF